MAARKTACNLQIRADVPIHWACWRIPESCSFRCYSSAVLNSIVALEFSNLALSAGLAAAISGIYLN